MATSDAPLNVPNVTLAVAINAANNPPASSDTAGYIAFDVPVINHATTGGTVPVRLVRRRGSTGSVTVSLSATDKFRAQGVQSYAGESVTFADSEMTKIVNVPLNAITLDGEAHFYLNCTITNALIPGVRWQELNTLVIVDDGSIWSGGTVLDDPATQIIQDNVVDNSIIYLRTGNWDDSTVPGYVELYGNDGIKGTSFRDKTNVVIRNYPGEFPVVKPSATNTTGITGIYTRSNNYVHVRGIEFTETVVGVYTKELTAGVPDQYIYIIGCHIHHYSGGDNVGAVRLDDAYRAVVFNNLIHDGFNTIETSNSITADPYGLHAGIHGYRPQHCMIYQNTFYHVQRAIYQKQPPDSGFSHLVARNFVYSSEGAIANFQFAGQDEHTANDMAVFENIGINCGCTSLNFKGDNIGLDQSQRALIYNNLTTGGGGIFGASDFKDIQFWNNLIVGGTVGGSVATSLDGRYPGEITYADYNGYELDYRYIFGRNVSAAFRSYDTFDAWQASDESQSADNQAPANPDANGAKGAPVFVGVEDYHLDPTDTLFLNQGRFAQESIGAYRLGHEQIGATI